MGEYDIQIGPLYLGLNLNILLYGITIMQTLEYYRHAHNDSKWIKRLVAFLFLGDTVNSGFDLALGYLKFASHFGDFGGLPKITWYGNALPTALTAFTTIACQLFYAYRIKRLSNKWWLFILIVVTATLQCVGGIGVAIAAALIGRIQQLYKLKILAAIWVVFSILTDALIALALVWHLHRGKTGFQSTDDTISKIIRLTIQTGLITTIWTILSLITYLCVPGNLYLFFTYPLSKIYTNSVMSSLNARYRWGASEAGSASPNVYSTSTTIKFKKANSSFTHPITSSVSLDGGVSVMTVTQIHRDDLELSPRVSRVEEPETIDLGTSMRIAIGPLSSSLATSMESEQQGARNKLEMDA